MRRLVALLGASALLLAGCGTGGAGAPPSSSSTTAEPTSTTSGAALSGTLTVFAAASLEGAFTQVGDDFEAAHPGVTVTESFAGSSDLVTQVQNGAPADVLASADEANMTKLVDAGLVQGQPQAFATNVLTIVTAPGNPAGVTGFADLARPGLAVVVCAPQVPCGAATERVEGATGVALSPVSEESSVTDVLTKVESGEADAGLVYVTDARAAADRVTEVPFPESSGAVNTYPVAALTGAAQPELAAAFTAYVTGEQGQQVLRAAGFGAP